MKSLSDKKINRKFLIIFSSVILLLSLLLSSIIIFVALFARRNINADYDEMLFSLAKEESVNRYYANKSLGEDTYEPELIGEYSFSLEKKNWYEYSEFSDYIRSGFIAVEDRSFFEHSGIDFKRSAEALLNSIFHFKGSFGASTITQQVIKNISGDSEQTARRKFTEMLRALRLERNHTKEEILEVYLNIIPMGENLVGIAAGAQGYFGKEPSELTLAEAATLIGITNAPTRYNPHERNEDCRKKRDTVLYAMRDFGVITEAEYEEAKGEPLSVLPRVSASESATSWFIETVNEDIKAAISQKYGISEEAAGKILYSGGLSIYTTENITVQQMLEKYFENTANFPREISSGLEYSMSISDSRSGNLLGIVGSVGKKRANRLVNMATEPHTPGSTLKPLALYAPLINERKINYATVFDDVPTEFYKTATGYTEFPKNYPMRYDGLTTVKDALRLSKNTVAIRLYNLLGKENIYRNLKYDLGIDTLVRSVDTSSGRITDLAPSPLALGQLSYGASIRRLTEAYTVFPSDGEVGYGRSFVSVYNSRGELLLEALGERRQIFRPECARIMNMLLSEVTDSGTAASVRLKNIVDTAGKTGTSGDDRDRLFIGYTPYLTAGIWCGYRTSDRAVGTQSKSHIRIWDEIMCDIHRALLRGTGDEDVLSFSQKGLYRAAFCRDSGKLYTDICKKDPRGARIDYGYFELSDLPSERCDRHVLCYYDTHREGIADIFSRDEDIREIALIEVNDRHFKKQITVTDAEYVYWKRIDGEPLFGSESEPFFWESIPEGEFVGIGRRKKQFNSSATRVIE